MAAVLYNALASSRAKVFDKLRAITFGDVDATLLKQDTTANAFTSIAVITASWFLEYSEYRGNFLLEIADPLGYNLEPDIQAATHIQIDTDIFVIRQADTLSPRGMNVTWKVFCDRFDKRDRFENIF